MTMKTPRLKISELPIDANNITLRSLATLPYVAYGSNLHQGQMEMRCPDAQPVGRGVLPNFRLVFRGVADVAWDTTAFVPVGFWKVTPKCIEALDRYEGFPGLYERRLVRVIGADAKAFRAFVYVMRSRSVSPPSDSYLSTIKQGYRHFELEDGPLKVAVAHSRTRTTPARELDAYWRR